MFNLIVSILAVVLMIAIAIAGLSYLGPAFEKGADKAYAAQILNSLAQVQGAEQLYKADFGGVQTSTVAALVTAGYLAEAPMLPGSVAFDLSVPGTVTVDITSMPDAGVVCADIGTLCVSNKASLGF